MKDIYVATELKQLLLSYMDAEAIEARHIRRVLNTCDPGGRMSMKTWWALLDGIQSIQQKPALGFEIGYHIRPEHFGVLGYVAMHCATLREVLFRLQKYQGLLHNYSEMNIQINADATQISWTTQNGLSTLLSDEVVIGAFIRLSQQLTGNYEIRFRQIQLAHPCPENSNSYEALLTCPVSFGHEANMLTVSNSDLNYPINTHEPHLLTLYEKQAAALPMLDQYNMDGVQGECGAEDISEENGSFTRAVACAITENLHKGTPTLEFIAALFDLSPRTLHRRLAANDQNFSSVLVQVRRQLSALYIRDSTICLSDVSQLLGYAEQSVFNRAFKQWHGCTPKQFGLTAE